MRSIEEQLQQALVLRERSTRAHSAALRAAGRAKEEYTELRRRIIAGETTGCPIRDFAVAGPFNPADYVCDLARKAEQFLKSHQGQLVLVAYEEILPGVSYFAPAAYRREHFAVGLLEGHEFSEMSFGSERYCRLPASFVAHDDYHGATLTTLEASFALDWRKEFVFGDDLVVIWLDECRPDFDPTAMLIDLGKLKPPEGVLEA